MHLDIDAFFASVEQLRDRRLAGKPVIVGNGCIASCSYEARAFGLHAGMGLSDARRLCPEAVVLDGNYSAYRCFAERVWAVCRRFCPDVDTFLDDAYLDLRSLSRLYPDVVRSSIALREEIRHATGLSATAGLGPSRIVARMAGKSAKPDGLRAVTAAEAEKFLGAFPVGDLVGVGRRTREVLRKLNVDTVAGLQKLPRRGLESLFGAPGAALYERSRGRDGMPVSRAEIPKSISRETAFHRDTSDPAEIRGMLHYLVERIGSTLRSLGCGAKRIRVKIRYSDSRSDAAARTLPDFEDLDGRLYAAALGILRKLHSRRVSLRHIGASVTRIGPVAQGLLFESEFTERSHRLASAVDAVRSRFGFSSVVAGKSLELLGRLKQDSYGYVLRTPSLTK